MTARAWPQCAPANALATNGLLQAAVATSPVPESLADAIGDELQSCARAPQSMATRYNADKVLMAAHTKAEILTAVSKRAREFCSCVLS